MTFKIQAYEKEMESIRNDSNSSSLAHCILCIATASTATNTTTSARAWSAAAYTTNAATSA